MLEASGLSKVYSNGVCGLDDLDFRIDDGRLCCLMGPNGAGKSTTINLFLNYIQPTSGEARVDGVPVRHDPLTTRRRVAYVPEQAALYGALTARQNIAFFAALAGDSPPDFATCLDAVGLGPELLRRRVQTFSKGMKQRLVLAIALLKGSRNLLLDEPTSGLDPQAAAHLIELLGGLRSKGYSILISSHDVFRVTEIADSVIIMSRGRVGTRVDGDEIRRSDIQRLYLDTIARSA